MGKDTGGEGCRTEINRYADRTVKYHPKKKGEGESDTIGVEKFFGTGEVEIDQSKTVGAK